MERLDYWRGFTGGLLAGVAIGAWIYSSSGRNRKSTDIEGFDDRKSIDILLNRESAERLGDPSQLVAERAGATRIDFERPSV